MDGWRKVVGYWIIFTVLYFVLAMFSLETRDPWSLSSAVWLPAGLVLVTLCSSPRIYWPLWGISAGLLHTAASLLYGRSVDIALIFTLLDLAVLFPLAIIWRSIELYLPRHACRTETLLLLCGICITSVVGGLLSMFILMLLNYPVLLSHFFTWPLSNITGCLSGLSFFIFRRFFKTATRPITFIHLMVLFGVAVVFLLPAEIYHPILLKQTVLYVTFGGSLMLAISLPVRTLSFYFLLLTLLVNLTTMVGYGPLADDGVVASQLYLLLVIGLGIVLAANEQEHALGREKQQQLLSLFPVMEKQQYIFFQLFSDTGMLDWPENTTIFGIPSREVPTLPLLLARIHPEDRESFQSKLLKSGATQVQHSVRLLLPDWHYHIAQCNSVSAHPVFGTMGVLMLYT